MQGQKTPLPPISDAADRYAICSFNRVVRSAKDKLPIAAVAQRMRESEVEHGSIVLFLALLSAFVAILILRAHRAVPVDSTPMVSATAGLASAFAAKTSSLRSDF
jgi:hypothetical protein